MKLLTGLLMLITSTAQAVPLLPSATPQCVENIHALPIFAVEVVGELANGELVVGSGTAFLVEKDVWVTAAHVLGENPVNVVLHGSRSVHYPLTILYIDSVADVAVMYAASGELTPLNISTSAANINDHVYTIGYPGYSGETMVSFEGLVSGTTDDGFVTSSFVSTGMSGGPTLRCSADDVEVVGLQTAFTLQPEIRVFEHKGQEVIIETDSNSGNSVFVGELQKYVDIIHSETTKQASELIIRQ